MDKLKTIGLVAGLFIVVLLITGATGSIGLPNFAGNATPTKVIVECSGTLKGDINWLLPNNVVMQNVACSKIKEANSCFGISAFTILGQKPAGIVGLLDSTGGMVSSVGYSFKETATKDFTLKGCGNAGNWDVALFNVEGNQIAKKSFNFQLS